MNPLSDAVYALRYPTGELVGLDERSGGYPYKALSVSSVKFWTDPEDAKGYAKVMKRENFSLIGIRLQHFEVK